MHVSLLFPGEYLNSDDLQGKEVTLTIARLVQDNLRTDKGTEPKWVLYFTEMEERHRRDKTKPSKKLVLNKTNAKTIAKLHGNETDDWSGRQIALYPTTCQAFGDTVGCIRIRDRVPRAKEVAA